MSLPPIEEIYPGIRSRYNERVYSVFEPDVHGPPSLISKQIIVQNYCPKISVTSTRIVDAVASSLGLGTFLELLGYFEHSLIQQDAGSNSVGAGTPPLRLNVRFFKPLQEQLKEQEQSLKLRRGSSGGTGGTGSSMATLSGSGFLNQKFTSTELYSLTVLDNYVNDYIKTIDSRIKKCQMEDTSGSKLDVTLLHNSIYLNFLTKLISSTTVSPFECFNHPIIQLFVISATDDIDTVRDLLIGWKNYDFPNWIDLESILELVLIIVDKDVPEDLQKGLRLQEELKLAMGIKSSITPIYIPKEMDQTTETITLFPPMYAHVDDDLARVGNNTGNSIHIPKNTFEVLFVQLQEIIYKTMIPYMEKKIRIWTEEVVTPRKSFTGRFFSASKKWGASSSSSSSASSASTTKKSFFSFGSSSNEKEEASSSSSFNSSEGYYNATSQEMTIRRLGDWHLMLRDYKGSFTTYELIKKDFIGDKAYAYLSSLQEFMIISLLIGASNKLNPLDRLPSSSTTTGGITTKIITDVINPLVDSTYYSYLSRCNLKTYTIRLTLITAELFFALGQSTAMIFNSNKSPNLHLVSPDTYYNESLKLFKKLLDSKLLDTSPNAKLMERIACIYHNYDKPLISPPMEKSESSYYETENANKLSEPDLCNLGRSRNRKAMMWLLLAAKELDPVSKPIQVQILVRCIESNLLSDNSNSLWLYREDGLLSKLKQSLEG
ncbi:hypothetical protein CANARDRAFT_30521 [[Candida] arabinofermentans NRRL YB-2248]|uniref:Uncharacterized protein n=1 Tax=[Candida] arabinofermentans NRRL YB-2248 TaxID=983967 RepID=A0A1E4STH7_9ASCO|nr:hypothetical protein CANARDRAFT_30521 [[Candida] arabinofermentans NRRL YB-2248]